MSLQTLMVLMLVVAVMMAMYANTSKRNKILCRFRRANKTMVAKWVKMQDIYVLFDGGRYDVIPSRIVFQWYTAGLVHMMFPQWVATLDYTYGKRVPLNPNTMEYDWENAQVRKAINVAEITKSYFNTSNPTQSARKQSAWQQYLPWIAIALVVIVAFYFNSKMQGFGSTLDTVIGKLNTLVK